MNPLAAVFFLACVVTLFSVPRRLAPVPLLVGACYMTMGTGLEIGPASLPFYRLLILVGLARVVMKGEGQGFLWVGTDKMMLGLAGWTIFASFFHDTDVPGAGPVYICGKMLDLAGAFFLGRIWIRDLDEARDLVGIIALLLVPVSFGMVFEKVTGKNLFSIFGGVPEDIIVRNGKSRAQGPFRHPILAGTVGATTIPLLLSIWNTRRTLAIVGIIGGLGMTVASTSSGPILSLMGGVGVVCFWRFRHLTPLVVKGGIAGYLLLSVVLSQPPYYLVAKIDITGGSTGWHRAFLIDRTFQHLDEWWLFGTDRTRHWMPRQGAINEFHTDITNYFIGFAVQGGLVSLLLVVGMVITSMLFVGRIWRAYEEDHPEKAFFVWCCGACLLGHIATSMSVAYFDQSLIFFWLVVAMIASLRAALEHEEEPEFAEDPEFV